MRHIFVHRQHIKIQKNWAVMNKDIMAHARTHYVPQNQRPNFPFYLFFVGLWLRNVAQCVRQSFDFFYLTAHNILCPVGGEIKKKCATRQKTVIREMCPRKGSLITSTFFGRSL
jgi:hypothetical protein